MNTWFSKILSENEICVFYFYFKNQRNVLANPVFDAANRVAVKCFHHKREVTIMGWDAGGSQYCLI